MPMPKYSPILFSNPLVDVAQARAEAFLKHGPLKGGPIRWSRLLQEEMREVEDELSIINCPGADYAETRVMGKKAAIHELAQLAQLCIGIMELIYSDQTKEEV